MELKPLCGGGIAGVFFTFVVALGRERLSGSKGGKVSNPGVARSTTFREQALREDSTRDKNLVLVLFES